MKNEKPKWVKNLKETIAIGIILVLVIGISNQLGKPVEPHCINTFSKRIPIPMDTCFIGGVLGDAITTSLYLLGISIFIYAFIQDLNLILELNKKYKIGEKIEDDILDKIIPPNKEALEESLIYYKNEIVRNKEMIIRIQKLLKEMN